MRFTYTRRHNAKRLSHYGHEMEKLQLCKRQRTAFGLLREWTRLQTLCPGQLWTNFNQSAARPRRENPHIFRDPSKPFIMSKSYIAKWMLTSLRLKKLENTNTSRCRAPKSMERPWWCYTWLQVTEHKSNSQQCYAGWDWDQKIEFICLVGSDGGFHKRSWRWYKMMTYYTTKNLHQCESAWPHSGSMNALVAMIKTSERTSKTQPSQYFRTWHHVQLDKWWTYQGSKQCAIDKVWIQISIWMG